MKIATWNLERPTKNSKRLIPIIAILNKTDADILILTETNDCIKLDDYHMLHSDNLNENYYKSGERRVSIYSKFPIIMQIDTYRNDTSICVLLDSPSGELAIYGTVIGIHGNRRNSFSEDLDLQIENISEIAKKHPICMGGDFNISFSDNYYFTHNGRDKLNQLFKNLNAINLTDIIPENIDHIVISNAYLKGRESKTEILNKNKKLSDHIGLVVTLE